MFFREAISKNSKSPVLQLVENIRTTKGPRQRLVASLGTYFKIPKEKQSEVARIVKERLSGQQSLFQYDSETFSYADKIVKKIQTEGKWDSAREQVNKFAEITKDKNTAQISILNRLITQDSEHAIVSWLQTVAVEEIIDIDASQIAHDRFYRVSDKLLKNQKYMVMDLFVVIKFLMGK